MRLHGHPTRRHLGLLTTVLSLAIAGVPASGMAQCAFDLPNGSSSYTANVSTSLVRAFVSCNNPGGNPANVVGLANVPGCTPVETFNQQSGSPADGWQFNTGTSYGRITIKRTSGGANLGGYPATTRDAAVTVKLYHIGRTDGAGFAGGTGSVQILFRATFDDYVEGDMNTIDFPMTFGVALAGGNVSKTVKVGDHLMSLLMLPRFPDCTSMEIVSIAVRDPNGDVFAVPGVKFQ